MLLRNTRTGFIYGYNAVLANDPEFVPFEEPKKVVVAEAPRKVVRKKKEKVSDDVQPANQ
jgi:hypothetical protein